MLLLFLFQLINNISSLRNRNRKIKRNNVKCLADLVLPLPKTGRVCYGWYDLKVTSISAEMVLRTDCNGPVHRTVLGHGMYPNWASFASVIEKAQEKLKYPKLGLTLNLKFFWGFCF